jgi:hypothetical protein
MKRLSILASLVAFTAFSVSAQLKEISSSEISKVYEHVKNTKSDASSFKPSVSRPESAGRNIFNSFILDYDSIDRAFGLANAGNGYQNKRFAWRINKNYSNDSILDFRNVIQAYDSLVDVDNNKKYSRATSKVHVDSLFIPLKVVNTSGLNDTFIISVLRADSIGLTGTPNTPTHDWFTPRVTWSDTIVLNQSLDLNGGFFPAMFYPNVSYPVGETFAVRLDFKGPESDNLQILGGYFTSCNDTFANSSTIPGNTLYYQNLRLNANANLSGPGPFLMNAPAPCNQLLMQTAFFLPFITVETACHSLSFNTTPAACGQANGGATVSVSNQTFAPYTYAWGGNASVSNSIANVGAGTYKVTVTGSGGCVTVDSVTISNTGGPTIGSTSKTDPTCFNGVNGNAGVVATGNGLTYKWSTTPQQTTATAQGLAAGQYTVTVTDAQNCFTTTTITVGQPTALVANATKITDVVCKSGTTGNARATATGGTAPYTFVWNSTPAQNNDSLLNVAQGSYTVVVSDSKGCTTSAGVAIAEPASAVAASVVNTTPATGNQNNGTATVSASGGTGPYTYEWSGSPKTTASVNDLAASPSQSVTVTDSKGCTATATFAIGTSSSISDVAAFNRVSVYPNPASSVLNIKADLNNNEALTVEMFDVTGKVVISNVEAVASQHNITVNVSGFAKGIYTIALKTKSGVSRQQVVVE